MIKGRQELAATQNTKQIQRLILSPQMQQALHLLQLPVLELGNVIEEELTQNPLLEISEQDNTLSNEDLDILYSAQEDIRTPAAQCKREEEDLKTFIENTIACEHSLFDHLMGQAYETFNDPCERKLAEVIIGNLDHDGLLSTPLEEIAALAGTHRDLLLPILREIQTFEPLGVGAQNIKEALLIQLKGLGKQQSIAFLIVQDHFEDMIHNRIPLIAKTYNRSAQEIRDIITHEITPLDLHPGSNRAEGHYKQIIHHLTPDITITYSEGKFTIEINDEHIPNLKLNHNYLQLLQDNALPQETRGYIQDKIASGKWLLRNLYERHQTLYKIAKELVQNQMAFFSAPKGDLIPLTMRHIAEKLHLHESTIARAVANKYVSCPRGILPLRSFFTHSYTTESGENISAQTVKQLLLQILENEDKHRPLSDDTISSMIKKEGIPCARRTVAKYRQELNIGNTTQRRMH